VTTWVKECQQCNLGKPGPLNTGLPLAIPISEGHFTHVHVDLVGPLPTSSTGNRYLLTMVDRATRWPEAHPLSNISAQSVADAFTSTWIGCFGVPTAVTTDRGTQFTGSTWRCLCTTLGIQHIQTRVYHPQSNGIVECLHRQLKEALRARGSGANWESHLPYVLLGIRAAPKQESNTSSAEAALGVELNLPGIPHQESSSSPSSPLDRPTIPTTVRSYAEVCKSGKPGDWLFVAKGSPSLPLDPVFEGPYRALKRLPRAVCIARGNREEWVSVDRVRSALPRALWSLLHPPSEDDRPDGQLVEHLQ